jgi:hypothetical protein
MSVLSPAGGALVKLMGEIPRGPKREGVFALWLLVRVAEDMLLQPAQPERAVKRRVSALEQRLSSLSLPAPLRRALGGALAGLKAAEREGAAMVLQQLVAPTRDALGSDAADVVSRAAKSASQRVRGG